MSTENLHRPESIQKLKDLAEDIKVCMLSTNLHTLPLNVRPMHTLEVDEVGNIWFFCSKDSDMYRDIINDPRVQLMYSHPGQTEFLSVYGKAQLYRDEERIKELWHPMINAWFDGSDDPNLTVLKIAPKDAYYWDTKHNKLITLVKIAASAATSYADDDGVKGSLKV